MIQFKRILLLLILTSGWLVSCKSTRAVKTEQPSVDPVITLPDSTTIKETGSKGTPRTDQALEKILDRHPAYFQPVLQSRSNWNVQIIYTQIDRDAANKPSFTDLHFNVNPQQYFYPASTVKFPVTLLALQKLNELANPGLNHNSIMITGADYRNQTPVYNDPTSPDGSPSIGQYIKKILLVSDNDAYNRLYEWLGPQYINQQLLQKGYASAQINHRLELFLGDQENRRTNSILFLDSSANTIYSQPEQYNSIAYPKREDYLGKGYYTGGVLIEEPMNFSIKNRLSLPDLHQTLKAVIFPEAVDTKQRFGLTESDYKFVWKYMSQQPAESINPDYNNMFASNYSKFLMAGGSAQNILPEGLRIFNKSGDAYGFVLDAAYIVDFKNQVEFMLSAVIYCNEDGILNDDRYDYQTIGLPFMQHLGEVIYQQELNRKKKHLPDLSNFVMDYDK